MLTISLTCSRYLIYGSVSDKFHFDAFLAEHPVDDRALLLQMVQTQQFSEFIDSRLFEVGRDSG